MACYKVNILRYGAGTNIVTKTWIVYWPPVLWVTSHQL